jgi:hypothetical protein
MTELSLSDCTEFENRGGKLGCAVSQPSAASDATKSDL